MTGVTRPCTRAHPLAEAGDSSDDWGMGRVTKDQADTLLPEARREDATTPDPSMRNPRPVAWDWIDVGRDDRTLRIEFVQGIVDRLHHVGLGRRGRSPRNSVPWD